MNSIALGLLLTLGGLAAAGGLMKSEPLAGVVSQTPIQWKPDSHDTALSAATMDAPRRVKVEYTAANDQGRSMEVLYGANGEPSNISLTKRNTVAGTANIQYPEGPGLRVLEGWAFITFQWPLIWTESIDAGSIGTTSVINVSDTQVDLYLVLSKKDKPGTSPSRPVDCTDPNARLYVRLAGVSGSVSVGVPSEHQAIRRRYKLERDAQNHVIKTTLESEAPLKVTRSATGVIEVPNDGFLAKVLGGAAAQGLYEIP